MWVLGNTYAIFEAQFMRKLSKSEAELKKSVYSIIKQQFMCLLVDDTSQTKIRGSTNKKSRTSFISSILGGNIRYLYNTVEFGRRWNIWQRANTNTVLSIRWRITIYSWIEINCLRYRKSFNKSSKDLSMLRLTFLFT